VAGPSGATGAAGSNGATGVTGTATASASLTCNGTCTAGFLQKLVFLNNGTQGQTARVTNNTTGNLTGIVGVATSSSTSGLSVTVVRSGAVNCTFDNGVNQGDYVQVSSTTIGFCTDAGSTYPTANQIIGVALSSSNTGSTGTSQTIFFYDAEVRGGSTGATGATGVTGAAGGATVTLGNSSTTPVTGTSGSPGTISGTSVVYFITDGDYAALPLATTAGQQLTLLDISPTGGGFYVSLKAADTLYDEATSVVSSQGQGGIGPFGTVFLISDGSHHWFVPYSN
jgi:hypothetical protein